MLKIKKQNAILLKIFISGMISILFLSLFCLLYSYSGIHISNKTGATDYKWESKQFKANMNEGFSWNYLDEDGFHNKSIFYNKNPKILLMGSSHMEGIQVKTNQTVGGLLNNEISTYNIGISGHTIYRCVKNIKQAVNYYKPLKYVIIETDRVDLEVEEIQAVIDESLKTIPSYENGLFYILQKIPVVKVIYKNIMDWYSIGIKLKFEEEKNLKKDEEIYVKYLDTFIKKAVEPVFAQGCKLIIFYHPNEKIDNNGIYFTVENKKSIKYFEKVCKDNNVIFVDMSDSFKKLYKEEHKLAHGFINTAIGRGHLNKYGHKIISQVLLNIIKEDEEKDGVKFI